MRCLRSAAGRLFLFFIIGPLGLAACSTNGTRIDRLARSAGLQKQIVRGTAFSHVVYEKTSSRAERLFVFLEGDGAPWGTSGMQPALDPTARYAMALRLMMKTEATSIYVARPCYQDQLSSGCTAERWTFGRYAADIVDSMVAVISSESSKLQAKELVIVGYSGGGVLATLVAERMQAVAAVITIGANLDIDAWTKYNGNLPLSLSLNPARSERAHPWPEFHFSGANDKVVPDETAARYFQKYPQAQHFVIADADHVCCWESDWPGMLQRLELDRR